MLVLNHSTFLCGVIDFCSESAPFGITYKDLMSINLISMGSLHAANNMQSVGLNQMKCDFHGHCSKVLKKFFLKTCLQETRVFSEKDLIYLIGARIFILSILYTVVQNSKSEPKMLGYFTIFVD